ncbi:trypsin epsilon-like [Galleria mellonella]|uniref:Trypsin epsilon-like n=1 Tax=Galleria mellonella TaxID=7137 RepID=A0A6J1WPV3_GALME|nr:trypsin epsilon-like [Galleria mellonella]
MRNLFDFLSCLIIVFMHGNRLLYSQSLVSKKAVANIQGKIVGGKAVNMEMFPTSVQFFNVGAMCGGTILNSWSVLTAAHCFDVNTDVNDMVVQVGSRYFYDFNAKSHDIFSFAIHERYNKSAQFACDIALLFLQTPIKFTNKSKKALIVTHNMWMNEKEKTFIATGWGWTTYDGQISQHGLMMTTLKFISSKKCSKMHGIKLTADMFCLYGEGKRDTCRGDSGGGVLWNGMLVGITSHGDGCAKKYKPSVYANVWYLRNWIEKTFYKFKDEHCLNNKVLNMTTSL